jgi:hypothetical protein
MVARPPTVGVGLALPSARPNLDSPHSPLSAFLGGEKKLKIQMAKGKWQMVNHLKFAICHLPFELLVCP